MLKNIKSVISLILFLDREQLLGHLTPFLPGSVSWRSRPVESKPLQSGTVANKSTHPRPSHKTRKVMMRKKAARMVMMFQNQDEE